MPTLRVLNGGRLVYGGSPPRFLKLSARGAGLFQSLVGEAPRSVAPELADRLVEAGILAPDRPDPGLPVPRFAVVIPHYNDPDEAMTTLTALATAEGPTSQPELVAVVVDDGSEPRHRAQLALQIEQFQSDWLKVQLEIREVNRGPAATRNAGFDATSSDVTAFIDSGVAVDLASIESLVRWTTVATAAGPRVTSAGRGGLVGRFEDQNSALDMNAVSQLGHAEDPQLVGRSRTVRYLPTAVLAIRNDALEAGGGFDESMRTGEDVDLTWRLTEAGHRVVFDPLVIADHEPRSSVRAFARQRYGYGRSGAPLGDRHGSTIAPAAARIPLLIAIGSLFAAPAKFAFGVSGAAAVFDAVETGRRFAATADDYPTAGALGMKESVRFNLAVSRWWVRASVRAWWPLTALALLQPFSSRLRKRAAATLVLRLADFGQTVGVANIPMALVDEVAYGAGLWSGAIRNRSPLPLLPRILK